MSRKKDRTIWPSGKPFTRPEVLVILSGNGVSGSAIGLVKTIATRSVVTPFAMPPLSRNETLPLWPDAAYEPSWLAWPTNGANTRAPGRENATGTVKSSMAVREKASPAKVSGPPDVFNAMPAVPETSRRTVAAVAGALQSSKSEAVKPVSFEKRSITVSL